MGAAATSPYCAPDNVPICSRCCDKKEEKDSGLAEQLAVTGRVEHLVEMFGDKPVAPRGSPQRKLEHKVGDEFAALRSDDLNPAEFVVVLRKQRAKGSPGFGTQPVQNALKITSVGGHNSLLRQHNSCAEAAAKKGLRNVYVPVKAEIIAVNGKTGTADQLQKILYSEQDLAIKIALPEPETSSTYTSPRPSPRSAAS